MAPPEEHTKLSSFRRSTSIVVKPEAPLDEPAAAKPCITPSAKEVEEILEKELATMHSPSQATKLNSFKWSTSIVVKPEVPVEEPATAKPCITPSAQELEAMLEKELETMSSPEPNKLHSFKRMTSINVKPEEHVEEPATAMPCITPSAQELEAMLEKELQTMSSLERANKLNSFKKSTSIAVRPEVPVEEPAAEQPSITPSVEELEAMLEQDSGAKTVAAP